MAQFAFVLSEEEERYHQQGGKDWDRMYRALVHEARILCRRADRSVVIMRASGDQVWSSDGDR